VLRTFRRQFRGPLNYSLLIAAVSRLPSAMSRTQP